MSAEPSALELQRRRLMQEREKMRARAKPRSPAEPKKPLLAASGENAAAIGSFGNLGFLRESKHDGRAEPTRSSSASTSPSSSKDSISSSSSSRSSEASDRKARHSTDSAQKSKLSVWNRIKTIDIKREMAENIVVSVLPLPEDVQNVTDDTMFDVGIKLRDTTWQVRRSIKDYRLLQPKVQEQLAIYLPAIEYEASWSIDTTREKFESILQLAARHFESWSMDTFIDFFDNRFGFLCMMVNAKNLYERVQTLEEAQEATKAHLKACQETVGTQQVLINTLQNATSATIVEKKSDPLPPLSLLDCTASYVQPAQVWENTSSSIYSCSRVHAAEFISKSFWVSTNDLPCAADLRLNRVVTLLSPTADAVNHRRHVFDYVASLVKKTVPGAQVFMVCGSAAHLFLPDSALRMGVFFPADHADASQWYMKVNEALCVASAQEPVDDALPVQHVELANVTSPRIHCNVGNVVIHLTANALPEIRGAYFLEAMDKLIGKNHLFKRSVLLVHGWLVYESGASEDKHGEILGLYSIATMVLYVFNLYHTTLHQPLQVAARFFMLFAAFPWDGFCVSIEGPRDMHCLTNPPLPSEMALLISPEVLEMHRTRHFDAEDTPSPVPATTRHDDMLQFKIKYLNIMDPIDPSKNLGKNVTAKQASNFRVALECGATKLHAVMMALKKETTSSISTSLGSTSSVSLLESAFRGITQRFQCGWRPDNAIFDQPECSIADDLMQSLDLSSLKRHEAETIDAMTICFESLRHDLMVCDFLVNAHVSAPALSWMASEILAEKGPLPIGEIGKCLQDVTSNAALSTILKEQFGGLKKFLELYPSVFLISSDHPFNPKVYLHRMLSESGAAQVLDGSVDAAKKKKAKSTRRKKANDAEQRALSLLAISSTQADKKGAGCVPPPGFGFPSTQQRSVSFESSLKLSAPSFVPAGQRKSVGYL